MAQSKEDLDAYIRRMEQDPHQRPIIGTLDGKPFGYFEVYWTPEDRLGPYYEHDPFDRGFHFLIGDLAALGKGTGAIIQSMVHFIFLDDPRTRRVMGEPRHDNIKLLRYLQTVPGWVKVKEFDFPHKRAALLQIRREDFFRREKFS
jgi:RimJ/RimL family protein N-acetyltransferase